MSLPGFTAEDSVCRTNMRYRAAAKFVGFSRSLAIFLARTCTDCFCDVVDFGLPGTCAKLCFDKPGDLEFPRPLSSRPMLSAVRSANLRPVRTDMQLSQRGLLQPLLLERARRAPGERYPLTAQRKVQHERARL
jgi:hypothetical protein